MLELKQDEDLAELLKKHKYLLLDFSATWCGPCKKIYPHLLEIEPIYSEGEDPVLFVKIDVDKCPMLASDFSISSIPAFHLIKDGKSIGNVSGADITEVMNLLSSR